MPNFTKIVSANYNDRGGRNTKHPWLIRDVDQGPELAKPAKAIIATGVAFCPSTSFERGFGCTTVAFCTTAEAIDGNGTNGVPLKFLTIAFFQEADGQLNIVQSCKQLTLNSDGSMYAVLNAEEAKSKEAA